MSGEPSLTATGPLDLLLASVQKGQTELSTVSLADVTQTYLLRLEQLTTPNANQMAAFIDLGARLVYLKSLALLPKPEAVDNEAGIAELNQELRQYQSVKQAATLLATRSHLITRRRPFRHTGNTQRSERYNISGLTLEKLAATLSDIAARQPLTVTGGHPTVPSAPRLSLRNAIAAVQNRLRSGHMTISDLDGYNRTERVVWFLAILELLKRGEISIHANEPSTNTIQFGPAHARA